MMFLLLLMGGFFPVSSCMRTREVEPPSTTTSDWIPPTDYTTLLANWKKATSTLNIQNYLRCFSRDSLRFVPPTSVYTGNQLIWDNWSYADEQTWFSSAIANLSISSGNSLVINQTDLQNVTADSLRFVGDYILQLNHADTTVPTRLKGELQLVMRLNPFNEWEIARWVDFETAPDSSWSRLKLAYVQ